MAAWFAGASSQGLVNLAFPLSTFPIMCGAWVYPTAIGGTQCVFTISIPTGTNYITMYIDNAGLWTVEKTGGGVITCGTAVAQTWHYVIMRVISATAIRCSVLNNVGAVTHAINSTAGAVTGFTAFSLGDFRFNSGAPTNFLTGGIGELWISNAEMIANGSPANNNDVRRLAWDGPLLFGQTNGTIKSNLVEYRSLFSSPTVSNGDEVLYGNRGAQVWTNTNGVMCGPHPPLAPTYGKINPSPRLLTV